MSVIYSMFGGIVVRQGLERKPRKGGGFGAQGAAERPEEATARDHEPHSQRLRSCSGKPDGEHSEPGRPNQYYNIINFTIGNFDFFQIYYCLTTFWFPMDSLPLNSFKRYMPDAKFSILTVSLAPCIFSENINFPYIS